MTETLWSDVEVTWSSIIIAAVLCVLIGLWWSCGSTKQRNLPPGTFGWPIVGETIAFIVDGTKYMDTRLKKYGPVFKTSLLGSPTVVVSGAENVRGVLMGEGRSVIISLPKSARGLFGKGALSTSVGEGHRDLHRAIVRTFRPNTLSAATPLIHGIIRDFVAGWRTRRVVESGVRECRVLSFTIATRVLLGLDFTDTEVKHVMALFDVFNESFFCFPVNLPGFQYRKGLQARAQMIDILTNKLQNLKPSNDSRLCLFLEMVKHYNTVSGEAGGQSELSDSPTTQADPQDERIPLTDEFKCLALELVFGSHETIASACCALTICLAENPVIHTKVRGELSKLDILTASDAESYAMTYSDVASASYVNCVMKEVLRLMPPLAGAFRRTLEPCELMGYHIPAGWTILYTISTTHLLSPMFADSPEKFSPERWATHQSNNTQETGERTHTSDGGTEHRPVDKSTPPEQAHTRSSSSDEDRPERCSALNEKTLVPNDRETGTRGHADHKKNERFQYIPFGGGPRICVGREFAKLVLKLFIIEMVRTGDWTLINGVPKMVTAPIPFPEDNLPLRFDLRHS